MKGGINFLPLLTSPLAFLKEKKACTIGLGKALSISLFNQMVSSGTNFALGLYIARVLTPFEFGLYGIGFSIILFYGGIGGALLLTQMVVHVPDKAEEDRLPYAARMLGLVALFCLFTLLAAGLLVGLGIICSDWLARYSGLGCAITAASMAYLFKDFFVRHAYTARKEIWALAMNLVIAVVLVALLFMQDYVGYPFTVLHAVYLYAMSNITGALCGFFLARLPLRSIEWQHMVKDMLEAWRGGRWAIGGSLTTWVQSQAYTYITALFLGPAGVGHANAARMLITPFAMLVPAVDQMTMPRLAALRVQGGNKMIKVGFMITTGLMVAATVYSLTLILASGSIVPLLFGSKFSNLRPLITAWALCLMLQLVRGSAGTILQVMKHFRMLMLANTGSATATIGCTVILIKIFGIPGAIIATGIGDVFLSLMLWRIVWNERGNIH